MWLHQALSIFFLPREIENCKLLWLCIVFLDFTTSRGCFSIVQRSRGWHLILQVSSIFMEFYLQTIIIRLWTLLKIISRILEQLFSLFRCRSVTIRCESAQSNYTANKQRIRRTNTDAYYRRTTAYFVISHKGHRNYSEHGIQRRSLKLRKKSYKTDARAQVINTSLVFMIRKLVFATLRIPVNKSVIYFNVCALLKSQMIWIRLFARLNVNWSVSLSLLSHRTFFSVCKFVGIRYVEKL